LVYQNYPTNNILNGGRFDGTLIGASIGFRLADLSIKLKICYLVTFKNKIMLEVLSEEGIEHVLQHQLLGHIGCHADNTTYVVPICYAYDNNCIYGRTYEGMKLEIIRKNPTVCFQVEYIENMIQWQSVVCWGEFKEITDINKRNNAIQVLKNRISVSVEGNALQHFAYWPFSISDSDNIKEIIFCIDLTKKTGRLSSYHNPIA
jgi:nitroimidazol reductase NimA-like FMN-containing flavoprotein (pyridoxamine 5'-phosphate oxidase superfamily)